VAKAVRQYLMLPRGPVKNMTTALEDFGVVVVPFDPGTHMFSGASLLTEKPNYVTVVNASMPGDRWRYTLAHELGHIVMHSLPTPNMEEEADRFASEFLMPSDEIGPYLSDLTMDKLASLKKYWNVSMAAILKHAQVHGKITERQYRLLWEKMGKAGYRMREPAELDVPVEKPTILPQLLELHLKELGYTTEQLCDKLAADPEEFARLYMLPERRLRLVSKFG
jgi:Zn-dependent peptidase ImmA (M78 family)